jgi:hypothetical protein
MNSQRKVDYFEQRLRATEFERWISSRIPAVFRWMFFIPVGLVVGVGIFAVSLLVAPMSGDEDVTNFAGMAAGFLGGFSSVLVGIVVAPRGGRVVAACMGGACIALTAVILLFAWKSHNFEIRMGTLIGGGIYSACAVVAAVVLGKPEGADTEPNQNVDK